MQASADAVIPYTIFFHGFWNAGDIHVRGMDYNMSPWNLELTAVETEAPAMHGPYQMPWTNMAPGTVLRLVVSGRYTAELVNAISGPLTPAVPVASRLGFRPELTFAKPATTAGECTVRLTGTALTPLM